MGDEIAFDLNGSAVRSSYIHGDVVSLSDGSGYITRNYDYDPFGVQLGDNAVTDENPYRYSGEYYDVESGYTYLQARYYDPEIGRFINEDPALDGYNWYIYCGNAPINSIDPSGMWSKKIHYGVTSVIAKGVGFTASDAEIIAAGDRIVDLKLGEWSSFLEGENISQAAIKAIKKLAKTNQTGFTYRGPGVGKADMRLAAHYKAKINNRVNMGNSATKSFGNGLKGSVKKFKKGDSTDYITRLLLLGIRLHAQQDYWSHRAYGQGDHVKGMSDEIEYDYMPNRSGAKKGYVKVAFEDNRRLKDMVNNTFNYLNRAYKELKNAGGKLGKRTINTKAAARKAAFERLRK